MAAVLTTFDEREFANFITESVSLAVQKELSKITTITPATQKLLFSRHEAAEFTGISLVTLDSYVKSGFIKAFRLGYKVRFKYDDLMEALTKINVGGPQ